MDGVCSSFLQTCGTGFYHKSWQGIYLPPSNHGKFAALLDIYLLGGGLIQSFFFIFSPKMGEMIQFDLRIFFKWVIQPQCVLSRHSPFTTWCLWKIRGSESSTSNHGTVVQKRDGCLFLWQFLGTNKPMRVIQEWYRQWRKLRSTFLVSVLITCGVEDYGSWVIQLADRTWPYDHISFYHTIHHVLMIYLYIFF